MLVSGRVHQYDASIWVQGTNPLKEESNISPLHLRSCRELKTACPLAVTSQTKFPKPCNFLHTNHQTKHHCVHMKGTPDKEPQLPQTHGSQIQDVFCFLSHPSDIVRISFAWAYRQKPWSRLLQPKPTSLGYEVPCLNAG